MLWMLTGAEGDTPHNAGRLPEISGKNNWKPVEGLKRRKRLGLNELLENVNDL